MRTSLFILLSLVSLASFAQVKLPQKKGGGTTTVNTIGKLSDTTITAKIDARISYDTSKVVIELLGDDGTEYLKPVYKRGILIRRILTYSNPSLQPEVEWQKLYDDKMTLLNYAPEEIKSVTKFKWK